MTSRRNNILVILSCILLVGYTWVSAADAKMCKIASGPSKELIQYMQRVETIEGKLEDLASKTQCGKSDGTNSAVGSAKEAGSSFVASVNGALDYSNFVSSTEFYIRTILRTEIPRSIPRDHDRLVAMLDGLKRSYDSVYARCAQGTKITENLSDDSTYDSKGKTISTVLDELTSNHIEMINYYRKAVIGFSLMSDPTFILVGDNDTFKAALKKSYGPQAFEDCTVEWSAWQRIKDAIGRIGSIGGGISDGIQEWKDAWEYASTNRSDQMTIRLKLDAGSGDMGLSWGMAQKRSDALQLGLNSSGPSDADQWVSGLTKRVGERVTKWIEGVGRMFNDFKEKLKDAKTTDEYLRRYQEMRTVKNDIFDEVKNDYTNAKELMQPESQSANLNVASLLSTHMALQKANAELKTKIKISEQTCQQQLQGVGNCQYKN